MDRPPIASGAIPEDGAIELLRDVEGRSLTGVLEFESNDGSERGEIAFFGGEIAVEQTPREDGRDPVDVLLELRGGRYRLHQRLPPLPVAKGDDWVKSGSLAVHVPADLMNYCEHAGLTGVLELRHDGRKAEATYRAGELLAIALDGEDAADLQEVFGWEQGRFRIEIDARAPERLEPEPLEPEPLEPEPLEPKALEPKALEPKRNVPPVPEPEAAAEQAPAPPAKKREDTRQFLRVVEMALADVVHESERARSPTRTSPPLPPPPKARPRPDAVPPPRRPRREPTVRLIYLSGDAPASSQPDMSTRHVRGAVTAEYALTEAQPERRATPNQEPDAMAKKRKKKVQSPPKEKAPSPTTELDERASETAPAATEASPSGSPAATTKPSEAVAPTTKPPEREHPVDPVMSGTPLGTVAWTFAMLGVGLVVLMFLSYLPPVSCPPGSENCGWGAGCIRTSNDAENCGACGNVCPSGSCVFGECAEP